MIGLIGSTIELNVAIVSLYLIFYHIEFFGTDGLGGKLMEVRPD